MTKDFNNFTLMHRNTAIFLLMLLVFGWMMVDDLSAYERKVLFEDFTSST